MLKTWRACFLALIAGLMLLISACNSIPEGARAPKLEVQGITLSSNGDTPVFVISYSLEHASTTDLPLLGIKASVFLGDRKVAMIDQSYKNMPIEPNKKHALRIEVPINLTGKATLDSFTNNSLLVLQGSCALQAKFSKEEQNTSFNPSNSYAGFIHVEK